MRIGIFTDDFLPRDSGVVTSILQLRRGLLELGHEVYIIAPSVPDYTDTLDNVIRLPSLDALIFKVRAAIPLRGSTKIIDTLDLDIVHSMTQYNVGLYADYIAGRLGVPHVTTAHTIMAELVRYYPRQMTLGLMFYSQLYDYYFGIRPNIAIPEKAEMGYGGSPITEIGLRWVRRQIWSLQNQFLSRTDFVIAPSTHALTDLHKHGLDKPSAVIPNGIDVELFRPAASHKAPHKGLHVVTVGRLSGEKRQDALIRAIALTDNARLSIIGDGPSRHRFEKLTAQLGLDESRVRFYGSQKQAFIRDIMSTADIFALASYNFETQGMVMLEAAAAGLPVVYCDKRLQESISEDASFYVERFSSDFAALFTRLSANKKSLQAMRKHALDFAAGYDYPKYAEKALDVYEQALRLRPIAKTN